VRATVLAFCLSLLLIGVAPAQDSLNVRFIGNWPFGPVAAVALDSARDLAFVGSGGGIYVLDELHPGANDVRGLAPGVYSVRAVSGGLSAASCQKVIVTR